MEIIKQKNGFFHSKKKRRIFFISLALVLLIIGAFYTVVIRPKLKADKIRYEETEVERGTVNVTVNESGAIEYEQSSIMYDLDLDVSDEDDDDDEDDEITVKYLTVEEVYRTSGEIVSGGEPILKFDESSIEGVKRVLAKAVADAQLDYNDAKSEYELDCLSAELDYKTTLINKGYAKKLYSNASSKVNDNITAMQEELSWRQGRVTKLQEKIDEAQEDYDELAYEYNKIKDELAAMDPNQASSYLTYQQLYLQAQTKYQNALTTLENAQNELSENSSKIIQLNADINAAKITKEIDSIAVKQEYEETVKSGDNAYLVYTAKLESLEEDLKEKEDKLKERQEQQEALISLVGDEGIVYAPKEGMLVSVNVEAGDELKEEKSMVSYVCADDLSITVDVTEEDIVSLSIGQEVGIKFNAYPSEDYTGVITSIDTTASSTETNTVSYPVVISLEGILNKMYGGMTANVCFQVESSEDALYISRKALVEENGAYYVYVKSGVGDYELKKITIGLKNTSYVEVTEGLKENEKVYIRTVGK